MDRRGGRQRLHSSSSSSRSATAKSWSSRAGPTTTSGAVSDAPPIVGTCSLMCPESERAQRQRLRDLSPFERLNGDPSLSSPSLAVKKFCRTMSSKEVEASDVRPLSVLEETLDYLLKLFDSREYPFEVVHEFLFDRMRSVRQDLSMQGIVGERAIHMYQEMVKFHIISLRKLRGCSSQNTSPMHHLNMEQLAKTLTSLFNLYDATRHSNTTYEDEAEFCSFYVLLHLGSRSQPMGESLSWWLSHVPSSLIKSKEMQFSRKILRYFRMGNYRRFLSTVAAEASYLQYCFIEPYVDELRILAVSCMNTDGYKPHPYPLSYLSKLLIMKESDLVSFLKSCGLQICTDEEGHSLLPAKQTTFCHPKEGSQNYRFWGMDPFERKVYILLSDAPVPDFYVPILLSISQKLSRKHGSQQPCCSHTHCF